MATLQMFSFYLVKKNNSRHHQSFEDNMTMSCSQISSSIWFLILSELPITVMTGQRNSGCYWIRKSRLYHQCMLEEDLTIMIRSGLWVITPIQLMNRIRIKINMANYRHIPVQFGWSIAWGLIWMLVRLIDLIDCRLIQFLLVLFTPNSLFIRRQKIWKICLSFRSSNLAIFLLPIQHVEIKRRIIWMDAPIAYSISVLNKTVGGFMLRRKKFFSKRLSINRIEK